MDRRKEITNDGQLISVDSVDSFINLPDVVTRTFDKEIMISGSSFCSLSITTHSVQRQSDKWTQF